MVDDCEDADPTPKVKPDVPALLDEDCPEGTPKLNPDEAVEAAVDEDD